jgi:hypothetical protein
MPRPTETALKGRARSLLEAMTDRARWIYAVPRDQGGASDPAPQPDQAPGASSLAFASAVLLESRYVVAEEDRKAGAFHFRSADEGASFVLFDSAELDVLLVECRGGDAPEALAKILDRTGFYAQSALLGTALDVGDPEAVKALRTLAHMVVAWDEDWSDLFLLHLASPDPIVRHEASVSLTIAVMVAHDAGPAIPLLEEAIRRERYPKLKETLGEALNVITSATTGAVAPPSD